MRDLAPVELWWIHSAPLRVTVLQKIAAPPARVFAELAGDQTWTAFFPLMRWCRWSSDARGVGCEREVGITGFGRFRERFLVWDADAGSFGFSMIATSSPLMRAMGEHGRIHPDGDGTLLSWTVGAEPTRLGDAVASAVLPVTRTLFTTAFRRLARRLEAS
jgi:hypothetical protein